MELKRLKNRMKSILLHDEEWDFFLDAIVLASQANISYQSEEGAPEYLILVHVDGGVASTEYEAILDGGVASTRFNELRDGWYTILTPGVYGEDGTDQVRVINGEPQFQLPFPSGIETIILQGQAPPPEGFVLDSVKARPFINNATSLLDIMTLTNMLGLSMNAAQISPGSVAEYTYTTFFYKKEIDGEVFYFCPMLLFQEKTLVPATQSTSAKICGDYITFAESTELVTPLPILGYRNGVVDVDKTQMPTVSALVFQVGIKRVIQDYKKGDFSKTPRGDAIMVQAIKNALPIISFSHSWFFNAAIGGTQELPWTAAQSPMLVSLAGNDIYRATLQQVVTVSGAGISLPDADVHGVVSGTAPGTLRIAFDTNDSSQNNTAELVIETEHCGTFSYHLRQMPAGFEIETVNYQENQLLDWYNVPLAYIQPSYGPSFISKFPYRYGTVILFTGFSMPQFRLVPYTPYDIDFSVSPVGTDVQRTVQDTNYQKFPVDLPSDDASLAQDEWWQLHADINNPTQPESAVYPISADVTPQGTSELRTTNLRLNIAWFAMFTFDLASKTFYMLSCKGDVYMDFRLYSNLSWLSYFVQPGNFQLMDNSWFSDYTLPMNYDGVKGQVHVVWIVPETLPTETVAKNTTLLIRLPDRFYRIPISRPAPKFTRVNGIIRFRRSGQSYELAYLDLDIEANFVNTNIWIWGCGKFGSMSETRWFPMFKLAFLDATIDTEGGKQVMHILGDYDVRWSQGNRSYGWAPIEGSTDTPGSVAWFNAHILPIMEDMLVHPENLYVVARYEIRDPYQSPIRDLSSNLNGFVASQSYLQSVWWV